MKEVCINMLEKIHKGVQKIQYNSPVILTYTLLSFLALGLHFLTVDKMTGKSVNALLFSVYPSSLTDPLTYVRLFTHILGHVDFEHFLNNFLIILLIGPFLEEKYGSKKLLFMIIFTAFVTGIIHIIFTSNKILLGASGIVFMMMLLSSFVNLKQGKIPLTLIVGVIIFLGRELLAGFGSMDNISRSTHIIGGFLGASFGFFFNKKDLIETSKPTTTEIAENIDSDDEIIDLR